jgi:immune inhibitor A
MKFDHAYFDDTTKTNSRLGSNGRESIISLKSNQTKKCMIPPHPMVLAELQRQLDNAKRTNPDINVIDFLKSIGFEPGYNPLGRDDASRPRADSLRAGRIEMERIDVPTFKPAGDINSIVLLIDFDDNEGAMAPEHYNAMLFSENSFRTGSLRDYYRVVSGGRVNVVGQVSGWHRMPQDYSFYVGKGSGGDENGYPNNAKKMVEDAVSVALQSDHSINWDKCDINGDGMVDAIFVVHSGGGAEAMPGPQGKKAIWSHKWVTQVPIQVTNKTHVAVYLTVPEDGLLGVYAHEAGHLIFGWPDFYDACPGPNRSAGVGLWSLMAGGSWNEGGLTPAYPDGWCRNVQGWSQATLIQSTQQINTKGIEEPDSDQVYVIPIKGKTKEYFLVECRKKIGYDKFLPGEGLLVYHIDEGAENNCEENHLAAGVVQADGHQNLQRIGLFGNQGDDGDAFPGSSQRTHLNSEGFPNSLDYQGKPTGINISDISLEGDQYKAIIKIEEQK